MAVGATNRPRAGTAGEAGAAGRAAWSRARGTPARIVTIPVVTAQIISAVAKWCARIFGYTGALISSLENLTTLMEG